VDLSIRKTPEMPAALQMDTALEDQAVVKLSLGPISTTLQKDPFSFELLI
jgi:hypothetical protein